MWLRMYVLKMSSASHNGGATLYPLAKDIEPFLVISVTVFKIL